MNNRDFFIERLEAETPATLRAFRALPADRLDYRPHPKSRSAGELVALLVSEMQGAIEMCDTGAINWSEPASVSSPEDAARKYEKLQKELVARLRKVDEVTWNNKVIPLLVGGQKVHEHTFAGMCWEFVFDAVHHRGQLSVYIRPMGGKVPSIYGPSADDPGM